MLDFIRSFITGIEGNVNTIFSLTYYSNIGISGIVGIYITIITIQKEVKSYEDEKGVRIFDGG